MKARYLTLLLLGLAIPIAYADVLPNHDTYRTAAPIPASPSTQFANLDGRVAFMDDQRGVPTFIQAHSWTARTPHQSPAQAAQWYLGRYAAAHHRCSRH